MCVPCYAKPRRRRKGDGIHLVMITCTGICWTVTNSDLAINRKCYPFGKLISLYLTKVPLATFTEHARAESGV